MKPKVQIIVAFTWLFLAKSRRHGAVDNRLSEVNPFDYPEVRGMEAANREWKVMMVRHGESINNILSQSVDFDRYKAEMQQIFNRHLAKKEAKNMYEDGAVHRLDMISQAFLGGRIDLASPARDSFLSVTGEMAAHNVSEVLFGSERKDDFFKMLHGSERYQAIYVSPMRRTIATALAVFGSAVDRTAADQIWKGETPIRFKAAPWTHEQVKSVSDVGQTKSVLLDFVDSYAHDLGMANGQAKRTLVESLQEELKTEDWTMPPFYPAQGSGNLIKENDGMLCQRVSAMEEWITTLPEQRIIIVSHSAVIRRLFDRFIGGRKPDNIGIFVGTLVKPGNGSPFWKDIRGYRDVVTDALKTSGASAIPLSVRPGNPAFIPQFLKDKDEELDFAADDPDTYCRQHLNFIAAGPVGTVKCARFDKKQRGCLSRSLALTIDRSYLIFPADPAYALELDRTGSCNNCLASADFPLKMLDVRGAHVFLSALSAEFASPPAATSSSWVAMTPETLPVLELWKDDLSSVMLKRGKQTLLRFRFTPGQSLQARSIFVAALVRR